MGSIRFTLMALAIMALSAAAGASEPLCSQTNYTVPIRRNLTAQVGYFQTFEPQGAVVFVLGSQRTFEESKPFIRNFCRHGFSVAAFDLSGSRVSKRDYIGTASKIAKRLRITRPHLPLIIYGWSKGAPIAVAVAGKNKKLFSKLILENPVLDARSSRTLKALPRRMTRVFECRSDLRHSKKYWLARHAVLLVPAHRSDCSHHLSEIPEAQDPMLDYIESDFAGVQSSTWYFSRVL